MKKVYEAPAVALEQFVANEYVSACITGTIQCAYPGDGRTNGQMVYDDYNGQQSGWYKDSHNLLHGICGNNATITFSSNSGSGYEVSGGSIDYKRPIYNISGYDLAVGTYYNVTWNSEDGTVTPSVEYSHVGRLTITNIDNSRPNHS